MITGNLLALKIKTKQSAFSDSLSTSFVTQNNMYWNKSDCKDDNDFISIFSLITKIELTKNSKATKQDDNEKTCQKLQQNSNMPFVQRIPDRGYDN